MLKSFFSFVFETYKLDFFKSRFVWFLLTLATSLLIMLFFCIILSIFLWSWIFWIIFWTDFFLYSFWTYFTSYLNTTFSFFYSVLSLSSIPDLYYLNYFLTLFVSSLFISCFFNFFQVYIYSHLLKIQIFDKNLSLKENFFSFARFYKKTISVEFLIRLKYFLSFLAILVVFLLINTYILNSNASESLTLASVWEYSEFADFETSFIVTTLMLFLWIFFIEYRFFRQQFATINRIKNLDLSVSEAIKSSIVNTQNSFFKYIKLYLIFIFFNLLFIAIYLVISSLLWLSKETVLLIFGLIYFIFLVWCRAVINFFFYERILQNKI